ncbi:MAG: hypothetical protein V1747_09590 [Candidatus Omnitrophota bacterium]
MQNSVKILNFLIALFFLCIVLIMPAPGFACQYQSISLSVDSTVLAPQLFIRNDVLRSTFRAAAKKPLDFFWLPISAQDQKDAKQRIDPALVATVESRLLSLRDKPFISSWRNEIAEISAFSQLRDNNTFYSITILYMQEQYGKVNFYKINLPHGLSDQALQTVADFCSAFVNNLRMTWGLTRLNIDSSSNEFANYIRQIEDPQYSESPGDIKSNARVSSKKMQTIFQQQPSFFALGPNSAGEVDMLFQGVNKVQESFNKTPRNLAHANVLGIEIGQTKVRIGIVKVFSDFSLKPELIGQHLDIWTWDKTESNDAQTLLNRIIQQAKRLVLENNIQPDGIGITIGARTKEGYPVDIPLGVIRDFSYQSLDMWKDLRGIFSKEFNNVPCLVENDGNGQVKAFAVSSNTRNLLLLRFGTTLCAGYLDGSGKAPRIFGEFNKVIIDMADQTSTDPYYKGKAGNYMSFKGIIHIAKKLGFVEKYHIKDENIIPKVFKQMLESGNTEEKKDAELLYKTIGKYIAEYIREISNFFPIENTVLVGTQISGAPAQTITNQANKILSKRLTEQTVNIFSAQPNTAETKLGGIIGMGYFVLEYINGQDDNGFYSAFKQNMLLNLSLPVPELQIGAALNVADVGDMSFLPELENLISQGSSLDAQYAGVEALITMAERTARDSFNQIFALLLKYLSHPEPVIRKAILHWVFSMCRDHPSAVDILQQQLHDSNDPATKHNIEQVVNTLVRHGIDKHKLDPQDMINPIYSAI